VSSLGSADRRGLELLSFVGADAQGDPIADGRDPAGRYRRFRVKEDATADDDASDPIRRRDDLKTFDFTEALARVVIDWPRLRDGRLRDAPGAFGSRK
jgi:hypothetical protein